MEVKGALRVGVYEVGGGWELRYEGGVLRRNGFFNLEPYIGRYLP